MEENEISNGYTFPEDSELCYHFTCLISVEEEAESNIPQVPIPPSKWDKDEDEDEGAPGEEANPIETAAPDTQETKTDGSVVTSEVLKRAESVFFQKPFGGIPGGRATEASSKKTSPKRKSDKGPDEGPPERAKGKIKHGFPIITCIAALLNLLPVMKNSEN
jgi:hypothetical protein